MGDHNELKDKAIYWGKRALVVILALVLVFNSSSIAAALEDVVEAIQEQVVQDNPATEVPSEQITTEEGEITNEVQQEPESVQLNFYTENAYITTTDGQVINGVLNIGAGSSFTFNAYANDGYENLVVSYDGAQLSGSGTYTVSSPYSGGTISATATAVPEVQVETIDEATPLEPDSQVESSGEQQSEDVTEDSSDTESATDDQGASPDDATTEPAATTEAATTDAAQTEAATTDAAQTEAATTDAAQTEEATVEAATTDAAQTEAATTDAAQTEAATTESAAEESDSKSTGGLLDWLGGLFGTNTTSADDAELADSGWPGNFVDSFEKKLDSKDNTKTINGSPSGNAQGYTHEWKVFDSSWQETEGALSVTSKGKSGKSITVTPEAAGTYYLVHTYSHEQGFGFFGGRTVTEYEYWVFTITDDSSTEGGQESGSGGQEGGGQEAGGGSESSVNSINILEETADLYYYSNGQSSDQLSVTLHATTDPDGSEITWSSSETSIATVDSNGVVTAVGNKAGTVTITAISGGVSDTCEVSVSQIGSAQKLLGVYVNAENLSDYGFTGLEANKDKTWYTLGYVILDEDPAASDQTGNNYTKKAITDSVRSYISRMIRTSANSSITTDWLISRVTDYCLFTKGNGTTDYNNAGNCWSLDLYVPKSNVKYGVTVNYIDAETGSTLETVTGQADLGASLSYTQYSKTISGYTFDYANPASLTVSSDESNNVLNLYYRPNGKIRVGLAEQTVVYNGVEQTLDTSKLILTGAPAGTTIAQIMSGGKGVSVNGGTGTHVGSYSATVEGPSQVTINGKTYDVIYGSSSLNIVKRAVTLISADATKAWDGTALTNDAVSVSGDGFVEGEGATYTVTGSQTAVGESENTFTYELKADTSSGDYEITQEVGTLTVTAVESAITVKVAGATSTVVYNGKEQALANYTLSVESSDAVAASAYEAVLATSYTYKGETAGTAELSATDAGTYEQGLVASDFANTNTNFTNVVFEIVQDGELTITPATLTVTTNSAEKTYSGTPLTATGKVEGWVNGENATFEVTGSQTEVGSSANSYSIVWDGTAKESNYTIEENLGTLKVTEAAPITSGISITGGTYTYDGKSHGATVTLPELPSGYSYAYKDATIASYSTATVTHVDENNDGGTDADVITATIDNLKVVNASGKDVTSALLPELSSLSASLSIKPADLMVATESASAAYEDGIELTADGKLTGFVAGETASFTTTGKQTSVGSSSNTYSIDWNGTARQSDYEIHESLGTLTVTEFAGTIVATASIENVGYDGKAHGVTVTVTGLPTGYTYEASSNATATNVSDGTVVANVDNLTIYNASGQDVTETIAQSATIQRESGSVTIKAAQLYISTESAQRDYTGEPLTETGYTATGLVDADKGKVKISATGTITDVAYDNGQIVGVENGYTIDWGVADKSNYSVISSDDQGMSTLGTLTVTPAPVTLVSADLSKPYDGTALTNGEATLATEKGFASGEGATYEFTGSQLAVGSSSNTFTYKLNSNTKEGNYSISTTAGTLKVTNRADDEKWTLTVTGNSDSVTYDGTQHSVSGIEEDSIVIDGLTFSISAKTGGATDKVNAGTYANAVVELSVKVTDAEDNDVTAQFNIDIIDGSLTINKAEASLTAGSASKVYDSSALTNSDVTPEGFITEGYDGLSVTTSGSQAEVGSSVNALVINGITYTESSSVESTNYKVTLNVGALEVTQQSINPDEGDDSYTGVSITVPTNVVYDGLAHQWMPEVKNSAGELLVKDSDYTVSYDTNDFTSVKAIAVTITGTGNYKGTVTRTYNITPAPLTVTTPSRTKVYDGSALTFTEGAVLEGLVNGETAQLNVLGSQTEVGESDNTYEIDWNGTALVDNYEVTTENLGTLTVIDASESGYSVSATGWTYDSTSHVSENVVSEAPSGVSVAAYEYFDANGNQLDGEPTDAGTYTVKATWPASGGYAEYSLEASFTVAQAQLTVYAEQTLPYNGEDQTLTFPTGITGTGETITVEASGKQMGYTISGLVADEKLVLDASITRKEQGDSTELNGTGETRYTLSVEKSDESDSTSNYAVVSVAGKLTIDGPEYANRKTNVYMRFVVSNGGTTSNDSLRNSWYTLGSKAINLPDQSLFPHNKNQPDLFPIALEAISGGLDSWTSGATFVNNDNLYDKIDWLNLVPSHASQGGTGTWKVHGTITFVPTLNISGWTYDGSSAATKVTSSITTNKGAVDFGNATYTWKDSEGNVLDKAPVDAGTYSVIATWKVPGTSATISSASVSFTVAPRSVTLTSTSATKTYDGTALVRNAQTDVVVSGAGFVEGEGVTYSITGSQTVPGTSDNDFTYTLSEDTLASNYNITCVAGKLTVTSSEGKFQTLEVVGNSGTVTYDGSEKSASGIVANQFVINGITYTVNGVTTSDATGTNAGTYTNRVTLGSDVTVTDENGNDVTSEFTLTAKDGGLTITKRQVTLTSATDTKQYDGTALTNDTITVGADGFAEGEGADYKVTGSQTIVGSSSNTFTYTLTSSTKAANYTITTATGTLTVTNRDAKYEIVVVANSETVTYDGAEHSATGLVSDTFEVEGNTYTVSGLTTQDPSAFNVGEYTNNITGTAVVTDAAGNDVTSEFSVKTTNGKLIINKRDVTLTSASDTKEYDGSALTNSGVVATGFVEGQGATYNVTGSQTLVGSSKNAFTYTLSDGTNAKNYTITKVEGTLTVTNREAKFEVTLVGNSTTGTYDGSEKSAVGVETDTFTFGDVEYTVSGFETEDPARTDAGSYTNAVTGTFVVKDAAGNDVTEQFSVKTTAGSLVINKRNITLTSANAEKEYDGSSLTNDEVTVSGDGFAGSEGAEYAFTGSQTIVGHSENTFSYTLVDGAKAENYNVTVVFGTLTVTNREAAYEVTVEANSAEAIYDGAEHSATGLVTDTFEVEGNTYTVSGLTTTDPTEVNAGTYANNITGTAVVTDAAGNDVSDQFSVTIANGNLNILPRTITLSSGSAEKVYDGTALTNDTITVSGDGFVEGEGAAYTVSGSQTGVGTSDNAFTYALSEGTLASNYTITTVFGTLTVTAAPDEPAGPVTPDDGGTTPGDGGTTPDGGTDGAITPAEVVPAAADLPAPLDTIVEVLEDAATPIAEAIAGEPEEATGETIDGEQTPLATREHKVCWVHIYMALGAILSAIYGIGVFGRRMSFANKVKDFEDKAKGGK